jgi:hypothetical protein
MAILKHDEENGASGTHNSDKSANNYINHAEDLKHETVHDAAERGHAATDR